MKVLHLVKTSVGAGWALSLMRQLVRLGIEVHVALPPGGPLIAQYEEAGIQTHVVQTDFPIGRPWLVPRVVRDMRSLVSALEPDVIHSHFVGTTLTVRLALGKRHPTPRIFQVPGPLHLEHLFFRVGEIATSGASDYWIGSCQWTCERYRNSGISSNRVFLSYYGSPMTGAPRCSRGKLRAELGLEDDTKLIGMVAYMYRPKAFLGQTRGLKGHEDLIDAVALLRGAGYKVKGVFVGGAWANSQAYERQVREYGRRRCGNDVIFLGTRMDVPELYPDFDVAVHPSHSENIGGADESFLHGVPTVATNVGGFPDLVIPGVTGWLVPPKSPPQLAQAIAEALDSPDAAHALALEGQRMVFDMFDVANTANQVAAIYADVVSR